MNAKEFYCGSCNRFKPIELKRTSPTRKNPLCGYCEERAKMERENPKNRTARHKKAANSYKKGKFYLD